MILDALFPALRRSAVSFETFPPPPGDDFWYGPIGGPSSSGMRVTEASALAVSAMFACVRVIAETCASLPLICYERTGKRTKERATDHPLYRLLHDRPNRWQTSFEFREMKFAHLVLRGNFFARIILAGPGEVGELVPLHPDRMRIEQLSTGRLRFHYSPPMAEPQTYSQDDIHYVRGLSLDGVTGISTLTYARNALGLAAAQETSGAAQFKNGLVPPFFLTTPNKMSGDAKKQFRENWRGMHAGAENAGNPPVFDQGMEAKALGLTNKDSQWLESRKFEAEEIARFNRMQPHKIGLLDRATFSNIEQMAIEFVVDTIRPWLVRDEQAMDRDLVDDPDRFFVEYLVDGLLRGDTPSRYRAYDTAIKGHFMTPNEARERENWNPLDGGDEFPEQPGVTGKGGKSEQEGTEGTEGTEEGKEGGKEDGKEDGQQPAFALLLEDAAARIAAAEIRGLEARAAKADQDRDRWSVWVAQFYVAHAEYMEKVLLPIADAWSHVTDHRVRVDVQALAKACCTGHRLDLQATSSVPVILDLWRAKLAGDLIMTLNRSFFDAPIPEDS